MPKKVSIETPVYDAKRFSKPWILRAYYSTEKNRIGLDRNYGEWLAIDGKPGVKGERGRLEIEIEPGDVIARGRKDHEQRLSTTRYSRVEEDGGMVEITAAAAAAYLKGVSRNETQRTRPAGEKAEPKKAKEAQGGNGGGRLAVLEDRVSDLETQQADLYGLLRQING